MDVLTPFEGDWRLTRVVDDNAGGEAMRFGGLASLSWDGVGLTYAEEGRWTVGSYAGLAASRTYLWRAEGATIAVLFEDGRPFHRFQPVSTGRAESSHDCPPDLYAATYDFALPADWALQWRVRGPRKDYLSRTEYRRR